MPDKLVYLDHAATTYVDDAVLDEMTPYFRDIFGNASSQHLFGRRAVAGVDFARERVAKALGAKSNEIYFTSGGTEADNWAIRGIAEAYKEKGKHIITSAVEHHAVLHVMHRLEKEGYEVTYLPVDAYGAVSSEDARNALRPDTVLVSVMLANNEVGTIQPIREIARAAHERGIIVHTDAVQAIGQLPVKVDELEVDLLSLSGHKFYAPKGVGALYVRKGVRISPMIIGGAQERSMRGGTYNTPAIVGLGKAIEIADANVSETGKREAALRDYFLSRLFSSIPNISLNGASAEGRLPNNAHIAFLYVDGEALLQTLDRAGIAASSGSACSSGTLEPSHVLEAMKLPAEYKNSSVRFTLGKDTTKEDIDYTVEILVKEVERLRKVSDLFKQMPSQKSEI